MTHPVNEAIEDDIEVEDVSVARKVGGVTGKGFLPGTSGNPQGSHATKGIVDYIKGKTNNYRNMVDLFVGVMDEDKDTLERLQIHPSLKDRIDCAKELLDRSIGKPTQTIIETGDDVSKELLSTFQKILRAEKPDGTSNTPVAPVDLKVTPIEAMKRKVDSGDTERPHGGVKL